MKQNNKWKDCWFNNRYIFIIGSVICILGLIALCIYCSQTKSNEELKPKNEVIVLDYKPENSEKDIYNIVNSANELLSEKYKLNDDAFVINDCINISSDKKILD